MIQIAEEAARKILYEVLSSALRPDPETSVSEWAAAKRMMTSATTQSVGLWENERNSLLTDIMDALSPSSPVKRVTLMGPSQFGKTEVGLNWLGHCIDLAPAPFLIVRPDLGLAKRFSRQRVDTMIEACDSVRSKVSRRKARDRSNTTFIKEFEGGLIILAGAKSAASLRDMPASKLWMDELDAYVEDLDKEGDPASLAVNRTLSFGQRAKVLETSTPKTKGTSRIEAAFNLGDRSLRHLPCPLCGHYQPLKWGQVKWTRDENLTVTDVHYECASCKGAIGEEEKADMLSKGRWISECPEKSDSHRSFQWNALYHPPGAVRWIDLAQMWVNFHHPRLKVTALKDFVMTKLAEPFEEKGEAPEWERLYRLKEDYQQGTIPKGGLILTAGVDVQGNRIQGSVYAWGRELERWLVDRFTIPGDTATDDPWKALEKLRTQRIYLHEGGQHLDIRCMAIDTGYRFHVVLNWARRKQPGVIAVKGGNPNLPYIISSPKQVDVNYKGRKIPRGAQLWTVGTGRLKEELYTFLNLDPPTTADTPFPRGYCHYPGDLDDEFFRQLTAEDYRKGKWVTIHERNEALDEACYARAAAAMLGVDRWGPEVWTELERLLGVNVQQEQTQERAAPADALPGAPKRWRPRKWRPGPRHT